MLKIMINEYKFWTSKEEINILKVLYNWFFSPTFHVNVLIAYFNTRKNKICKRLLRNRLECKYSVSIYESCKIGNHLWLDHFHGIVIGEGVVIGNFCKIYQQVTIGQKDGYYPVIGNNVTIYPGAKVLGNISIGDNSIIGANSVVINNVPENSVVAGIPATIIKMNVV